MENNPVCIFSPEGYAALLDAARAKSYQMIGYDAVKNAARPSLLLRHDIDFSMEYARHMARIEADKGIKSTYFVMLRSPIYSLCSRRSSQLLREIVAMGHHIGLHFDAAFTQGPERTQEEWLRFEAQALSTLANAPITAFSLHQPTQAMIDAKIEIEGMVNTYHPEHLQGFEYISDSNRDWRGKNPFSLMEAGVNIQLLIHPMWWMSEAKTTQACWDEVIALNFEHAQNQILATERAYGKMRTLNIA
jgi:hypothetical protein